MLLSILYIIGITAEGMTGALAAGREKMDIFGVIIIASVTAIGGGSVRSWTIGANYSFNRFVQVMLDYTYHNLHKDYLSNDRNFHAVQARMQFVF